LRGKGWHTLRYLGWITAAIGLLGAVWLISRPFPRAEPITKRAGKAHLARRADLGRLQIPLAYLTTSRVDTTDEAPVIDPRPESRQTAAMEFRDPFYAFVVGIAEGDSLGIWTGRELEAFLDSHGMQSNLPLEHFHSLERRAVVESESEYRRGVRVARIWRLTLNEPLDYPMPYQVLGYPLGSVSMARVLTFSEWRLGNCNVHAPTGKQISVVPVSHLTVFRLDSGWIVMDVQGLLDKLAGRKLDDCWTQGFAICRQEGKICGLALSRNRDLRLLCGEIDFATNEITPAGRPLARGVAVYVRPWIAPPAGKPSRVWQYHD
jgi:hypothetical protein